MTIESQVADLTTQTTALLLSVTTQKSILDNATSAAVVSATAAAQSAANTVATITAATSTAIASATSIATTKASEAANSASVSAANMATVSATNTTVQTALAGTTSAAAQAANYRDQAIAASQVATAANENLAAMSQSLHSGNIVKMFAYDTGKDSDGGAWVKRCQDKSWFKETLGGDKWIGQKATLALAWATSGAAVNTVYQNTGDGKFYALGGTSAAPTQTEVTRGISREFPATSMIVAESGRVIIYDTSTVGCPMWRIYTNVGTGNNNIATITALEGRIFVGLGVLDNNSSGLFLLNFIADSTRRYFSGSGIYSNNGISLVPSTISQISITPQLVNRQVNDIAVTILDSSPIDPATGMKVPTIACIVGESLVTMADGSQQRIDQIQIGSKVKTLEGESIVTNWWDQGIKNVITLTFDNNIEITCTEDHKIRTTIGWIEAGKLTEDHEIIGQ